MHMSDLPQNLDTYQRYGYLQVNTHPNDENFAMQIYIPHNTDVMYMRRKMNAYGWQPWAQFSPSNQVSTTPNWTTASLQNGWKHSTGYGYVQYCKNNDGVVYIRGFCRSGSTTEGSTVFTLPEGLRPSQAMYKHILNNDYNIGVVRIETNGRVNIKSKVDDKWLCLDDISFKI